MSRDPLDWAPGSEHGTGPDPEDDPAPLAARAAREKPVGRRVVLGMLGVGALGIAFGENVQNGISRLLSPLGGSGLASLVPGNGGFVLYTITAGYPAPPPHYRLTVSGMVQRPLNLTVDDLKALPATYLTHDFQCVTGWKVDNVHWTGVRLTDLAEHAGAHPKATAFEFASFDGLYTESLTMDQARQSGAIVAYSMLGGPVSQEHGGPIRLYVPGMFGYKSIKWLSNINLVEDFVPGYWEQNGYPINAWISGHPPTKSA
ncbi:MAG: oxidoreductase molybdopterin binding [Acidimicrobiaceae bacterium]|nr:oxidoreductase molybdopterin binding [Acidimicrobiaceae bacterium]